VRLVLAVVAWVFYAGRVLYDRALGGWAIHCALEMLLMREDCGREGHGEVGSGGRSGRAGLRCGGGIGIEGLRV